MKPHLFAQRSGQQISLPNFRLAYLNFRNAYVIFKSPRHFWDQVGISESHERANPYKLIPYDLGCILKLVITHWFCRWAMYSTTIQLCWSRSLHCQWLGRIQELSLQALLERFQKNPYHLLFHSWLLLKVLVKLCLTSRRCPWELVNENRPGSTATNLQLGLIITNWDW